jgi:hypothetical protein
VEATLSSARTWISTTQFSLNTGGRSNTDYPTARNVRLTLTGSSLAITSISRASSTATVTTTAAHNLPNGSTVTISGATQTEYNVTTTITVTGTTTFTYTVSGTPATPATGTPVYAYTSVLFGPFAISSSSAVGNVATVTLPANSLPGASVTINKVEYQTNAPAFSDLFAEHNRLWALSGGELKPATYRGTTDGLKVYYTATTNNSATWTASSTQEVPYIDLTNKSNGFDELVKITSFQAAMVFLGRNQTFMYQGNDPTMLASFTWLKTIPVGCVHGNLVQQLPQDVVIFTKYGVRTLTKINYTEALDVTPDIGSDIDPTVSTKVTTLLASTTAYKKARSFFYDKDGVYGFKLDDTETLVYSLSETAKGWVFDTGLPATATAMKSLSDGRLIVGFNDQLYVYGNGQDTATGTVYTDAGSSIKIRWYVPWLQTKGQRWKNNQFQLIMEETAAATINIKRFKDWDTTTPVTTSFSVPGVPPIPTLPLPFIARRVAPDVPKLSVSVACRKLINPLGLPL